MVDALSRFAEFLQKPAGPLAAGPALFVAVWGFFKGVESVLNEETKLEIWVWLADRKDLAPTFQSWPDTFASLVDRVFGRAAISWRSLFCSCLASFVAFFICLSVTYPKALLDPGDLADDAFMLLWVGVLPDYVSLLKTRLLIRTISSYKHLIFVGLVLLVDLILGVLLPLVLGGLLWFAGFLATGHRLPDRPAHLPPGAMYFVGFSLPIEPNLAASLFTSIWLWLYAGSGFLLKAARRFDIGFLWFNRRFDIGQKPLSSIGLVAACIVALIYWAAVIVGRAV